MIEFNRVRKIYNKKTTVITNATFKIEQGEFVFLVGMSGAGKSTLLKMLYKAEKPSSGSITLYGRDLKKIRRTKLRRTLGIVFQDFESTLLKNKTAYENVAYVLQSQGQHPTKIKKKTLDALERMGVLDKMKHYPHELSGGEKQRVAIARAIVNKPEILICDEPTGNLDPENAEIVMDYLNQLNKEGTTVVMTTHNITILEKEKKRTLVVEDGFVQEKEKEMTFTTPAPHEDGFSLTNLILARDNKKVE